MVKKKRKSAKTKAALQLEHFLKPKHEKLSEKEKKAFIERYNVGTNQLPGILLADPAIAHLDPKPGDIIKIIRNSPTAGESVFYREVVYESAPDIEYDDEE